MEQTKQNEQPTKTAEELEAEKKKIMALRRKQDRAERVFLGFLFFNASAFFAALMMLIL